MFTVALFTRLGRKKKRVRKERGRETGRTLKNPDGGKTDRFWYQMDAHLPILLGEFSRFWKE